MNDSILPFSTSSTLGEMVDAAKDWNAALIKMVFSDEQDNPVGAVIVLHGEDTGRILKAIEAIQAEIDQEADYETFVESMEGDRNNG